MPASPCPCGSGREYDACCAPHHRGETWPETAADLMRSRYSAFAMGQTDYLRLSLAESKRSAFSRREVENWNRAVTWSGLEIVDTVAGGPDDETGEVVFVARFERKGAPGEIREHAQFIREEGQWRYEDGEIQEPERQAPTVRATPKTGRNAPCPCGSGKKFKKCCG